MSATRFRVVFVSHRNSMRSILAEACLAQLAPAHFAARSCGQPGFISDAIHPAAVSALRSANLPVPPVRPQDWDGLAHTSRSFADFVITLDEPTWLAQPRWLGQPSSALWALPDVAGLDDPDAAAHGALQLLHSLRRRLEFFTILMRRGADPAAVRSDVRDLAHLQ